MGIRVVYRIPVAVVYKTELALPAGRLKIEGKRPTYSRDTRDFGSMEYTENLAEIRIPARPEHLRDVRRQMRELLDTLGCTRSFIEDTVLATQEAAVNVIVHAYGGACDDEIIMRVSRRDRDLVIDLTDFGPIVNPDRIQPRDLDDLRPGGLGVHIMHQLMDRVEYLSDPDGRGNLTRLTKKLGAAFKAKDSVPMSNSKR